MTTALALIEQALGNSHTRKIEHTSAHGLDQELEKQHVSIETTWRESTHTYVLDGQPISRIREIMRGMDPHMDDLVMFNALADWRAKQVTIHGKTDGLHLQKPTPPTPGKYTVTTPDRDIQRADESYLRKAVAARIRRQLVDDLMANKPGKYSLKGNTAALWERESEYMLSYILHGLKYSRASC